MIDYIKNLFRRPSPVMMARQELEEAQRSLLQAQTGAEYARRMCEYHNDRIKRLTVYLRDAHQDDKQREGSAA